MQTVHKYQENIYSRIESSRDYVTRIHTQKPLPRSSQTPGKISDPPSAVFYLPVTIPVICITFWDLSRARVPRTDDDAVAP